MFDLRAFFLQYPLHTQIETATSVQRQIVDDWQKSIAFWQAWRAESVDATLKLIRALAVTSGSQASMGIWGDWYSGAVARWSEDAEKQIELGHALMDRMLTAVTVVGPMPLEASKPTTGAAATGRASRPHVERPADSPADQRWNAPQSAQSARYEAA